MKWISRIMVLFVTTALVLGNTATAEAALCPSGYEALCGIKLGEGAGGIIAWGVSIFFIIAIIVSLFFIIYGAFRWVTSGGDQNKVTQARQTIIAAIIGLVISLSTFFIINTVMYIFTGGSLSNLNSVDIKLR